MLKIQDATEWNNYYDFPDLKKIDDLVYQEKLVSLYEDHYGQGYMFYKVEQDATHSRHMIFKIGVGELWGYLQGYKSLYNLITGNKARDYVLFADVREEGTGKKAHTVYENQCLVYVSEIPEIYLPEPDTFYEKVAQQ